MPDFYNDHEITLGLKAGHSGHFVFNALHKGIHLFYKSNKRNNPDLSLYEVAFSNLLSAFLMPYLTPKYKLVKGNGEILGLASEHMCYSADSKEAEESKFYYLNYDAETGNISAEVQAKPDDQIYFFNEFPPGFFADFYQTARKGEKLVFDMDSLASDLCSGYTMEEDDLHKGNIGFYIVDRKGVKTVVFFKIDNGLVLSDSVMSHYESRVVNWRHGEHAFKITARDLINFPKLQDSKNHYWPTSRRYLVNPCDPKVYTDAAEIAAFAELANDEAFQKAKWRAWYKHILIESRVVEEYLARSLDSQDPDERAKIALITQATVARVSRLKAVLFSISDFRDYVRDLDDTAKEALIKEIFHGLSQESQVQLQPGIVEQIKGFDALCQPVGGFVGDDTPLHVAIRLGDYRYHETWSHFKEYANKVNKNGETPLDVAVKLAQMQLRSEKREESQDRGVHSLESSIGSTGIIHSPDVRTDPFFIINHLLNEGVNRTCFYREFRKKYPDLKLISYRFRTEYIDRARDAKTAEELIMVFHGLGEDHRFSLKMKKEISVVCMQYFLRNKDANESLGVTLDQLKMALNGGKGKKPRPELQFIRQLRSSLWIVRIIRGLLGGTSTQVELNHLLDEAKATIPSSSCCSCFFGREDKREVDSITTSSTCLSS
ncbi:substrate of the Dot/Icm secretion system [Legionella lansingensis]|uniref:Substrate of the Dot/Icm secretion system n=1 Tax=Legionella lansingensis TaxID=45067 RepID=A0A0W0VTV6_9GAMM|nr:Dot/Icm T4SS effector AnkK/LegA5 [Legionella lansingensis]KTD23616.1 substrate of the Dot/Icm secretion system [Legionella lansingensis]SNV52422.1 substrate of the Dot/Icm secretion system [Legionella lansingensis]